MKTPAKGDAKGWEREARRLRKRLEAVTEAVVVAASEIDATAKAPDKGSWRYVARILNALELVNDSARFSGLGVDFRDDAERKRRIVAKYKSQRPK